MPQSGLSIHDASTKSAPATTTDAIASFTPSNPAGISRIFVLGLRASISRSAIRLKPIPTKRAQVNAMTTQTTSVHITATSYDASTTPTNANGSANTVWGSFTKFAYVIQRDAPANVCPSRAGIGDVVT